MAYTDVFGGNLIFPSRVSYNAITTSVDVVLQWPTEQQIEGVNVVADVIDVDATVGGLNIDMPDARNTSTGNKATFNNVGGVNAFTVRDATGGTIQSVQPGEQWVLVLTDNTTEAGTWTTFQLGGNAATQASASLLAGDGLRADGDQLDQIIDSDVQASTPFTVVEGNRATCQIYTAGAGTCNLSVLPNAFFVMIHNAGSGTLNVVPAAGTIDGSANINIDPNGSSIIFTDGTDWFTVGLTVASTIAFDFVSIAVPGSGDFTLTGANLDRISYRFTGALTGNRRIIVPNTTQQYWVDNQTTGAFTLEVTTAAGSGQTIPQSESAITYCDATDVINAVSSTSVTFPITISQGGTSATDAATALSNLGGAPETRLIDTLALSGLTGGGDLTADRALELDVDNLTVENSPDFAADTIAFYDDDVAAMRKTAIENIGAIEVQDEGVPLATRAQSLDFVGQFVTASGAGATKTITIDAPLQLDDNDQIQFGTGNDVQFFFDGTQMRYEGDFTHQFDNNAAGDHQIQVLNNVGGVELRIGSDGIAHITDVSTIGAFVRDWIDMDDADGRVFLNFGNVPVVRTAATSGAAYPYIDTTGGWLVNNNTTGTGNNERTLTYTDHMMVGGTQDDRSLTTTMADDSRLVAQATNRQGFWKFEIFCAFRRVGGTANVEFDFDSDANISECRYVFDYSSEDGTPSGSGAADDKTTNSAITLGSASEEVMVRISGQFRMSANGNFGFRWRPTVSQIDTVSRMGGGWMTMCPIEIGV